MAELWAAMRWPCLMIIVVLLRDNKLAHALPSKYGPIRISFLYMTSLSYSDFGGLIKTRSTGSEVAPFALSLLTALNTLMLYIYITKSISRQLL